jgi:hypothetical protein
MAEGRRVGWGAREGARSEEGEVWLLPAREGSGVPLEGVSCAVGEEDPLGESGGEGTAAEACSVGREGGGGGAGKWPLVEALAAGAGAGEARGDAAGEGLRARAGGIGGSCERREAVSLMRVQEHEMVEVRVKVQVQVEYYERDQFYTCVFSWTIAGNDGEGSDVAELPAGSAGRTSG